MFPEKRKVGSSTPPLTTTTSQHSTRPLTCAEAVGDRQRPRSQIDRWCPSVAVIRRSLVHAGARSLITSLEGCGGGPCDQLIRSSGAARYVRELPFLTMKHCLIGHVEGTTLALPAHGTCQPD